MPRPPRLHVPGGFYYVILRGNHREALFGCEADRDRLNEIVAEVLEQQHARLHAFCYIHLNPLKAGMVSRADDYPWSSHRAYTGQARIAWLTVDFGLSLFGSTEESARRQYCSFMAQPSYASEDRIFEDTDPEDSRVLGSDRFIESLVLQSFKPRSSVSLNELAEGICTEHEVSTQLVRSSSRQRKLSAVRIAIAVRAIEERIATLVEVAAFLNREPASLSELLSRHRR